MSLFEGVFAFGKKFRQSTIVIRAEEPKVGEHIVLKRFVARKLTAPLFAQHKIPRPQEAHKAALVLHVERLALKETSRGVADEKILRLTLGLSCLLCSHR